MTVPSPESYTFRETFDPDWIDAMLMLYNKTALKRSDRGAVCRAFTNSFAVISCWQDEQLVGIGRMISDGEMYAGIVDVVVDPQLQGRGVGKAIVQNLIAKAPDLCIHLTSTFGNEEFYRKLGFRKHKTAMSLYPQRLSPSPYLE